MWRWRIEFSQEDFVLFHGYDADFSAAQLHFAAFQIRLFFFFYYYCVVSIPALAEEEPPHAHRNEGCGRSHWDVEEEEPIGFTGRPGHKHTNAVDDGGGGWKTRAGY